MPIRAWSRKRERQYEHIKEGLEDSGRSEDTAKEIAAQDAKDGKQAELISYGLLLIILLVAFGALVAAGLPLLLGATAVAAAVGLLGPASQVYALPSDVADLVVIIGLAVGVDYAMFYSRRMMEERDRGHTAEAAVEIAAATSGRADLILTASWDGWIRAWRVGADKRSIEPVGKIGRVPEEQSEGGVPIRGVVNGLSVQERGDRGKDGLCVVAAVGKEPRLARWMSGKARNGIYIFEVERKALHRNVDEDEDLEAKEG